MVYQTAIGRVNLRRDSHAVIWKAAVAGWQADMASRCHRLSHDVRKLFSHNFVLALDWHREMFNSTREWAIRAAVCGALPDGRMLHKSEVTLRKECPVCTCGVAHPDRRHWMWRCGQPHAPPRNNTEEGLAIRYVRSPATPDDNYNYDEVSLGRKLVQLGSHTGKVIAATDGSSIEDQCAGATGIALANQQGEVVFRTGRRLFGADQSNWAAEVDALYMLLQASERASVCAYTFSSTICALSKLSIAFLLAIVQYRGMVSNVALRLWMSSASARAIPANGYRVMGKLRTNGILVQLVV